MLSTLFVIGTGAAAVFAIYAVIAIYTIKIQREQIRTLRIAVNTLQDRLEHYEDVKRTVAIATLVASGEKPFWYKGEL